MQWEHPVHSAFHYFNTTPRLSESAAPELTFSLTDAERKVLALMKQGLSNTEIAAQLGVSASTIKTHASNMFAKMGVGSRVEAVTLGLQHGLIS